MEINCYVITSVNFSEERDRAMKVGISNGSVNILKLTINVRQYVAILSSFNTLFINVLSDHIGGVGWGGVEEYPTCIPIWKNVMGIN